MPDSIRRITFDDLKLYQAAFELRYAEAFLIWDRSGVVWSEMVKRRSDLVLKHAEPFKITFGSAGGEETELALELTRLGVVTIHPDTKLEHFADLAAYLAGLVVEHLQVKQFSRVGLRLLLLKDFPSAETATEHLLGCNLLATPSGAQFGIAVSPNAAEYYIRREDGKNGVNLRLKTETVKVEFKPSFGSGDYITARTDPLHRIILDVDCFIGSPVMAEQLRVPDWIAETFHIIRRDGSAFLGE